MYWEQAERLRECVRAAVEAQHGVVLEGVAVELPPRSEFGDMALPVAFELAQRGLGKPRELAGALVEPLAALEGVREVRLAGGGYLNVFLERPWYLRQLQAEIAADRPPLGLARPGKTVIEHTNINPNKAAHIGHLRNAVLGDTLVRMLRYLGEQVEAQNYIDDTGVQVADVVVGFEDLERLGPDEVAALPEPFDHHCWDLYARVGRYYAEDEARRQRRSEVLRAMESDNGPTARLAAIVARRVLTRHLLTMRRIDVHYDLLAWEGDVLRLDLWGHAFRRLQDTDAVYLADEGQNAGCWMMRLEDSEAFKNLEDPDKVLVRSDATATYVAKDIAYQMWKFGLLETDFRYHAYEPGADLPAIWSTTSGDQTSGEHPRFGGASRVVNVIDVRQSYLQAIVAEGLRALGYTEQADRSIHFAYEMVALTPDCCRELGIELSEEEQAKPFVEMSGRRGLGIKADDLLATLERLAMAEIRQRHSELDEATLARLAAEISVGSLRYFMLRFTRNRVVAFDFAEALNFRGETGAYLQNAVVRARSIFRKLEAAGEAGMERPDAVDLASIEEFQELEGDKEFWELVVALSRLDEVLASVLGQLELSLLARYAFQLAQRFHRFYDRYRLVGEPPGPRRSLRACVIALFTARMSRVLELMGVPVPERM